MVHFTSTLLIMVACVPSASAQVSKYSNWVPDAIRYCETVQHPTNLASGGVTCGYSSYFMMNDAYSVQITSDVSLGLINVGWITSEALRAQSGFWKTCKSYMVRVFDGIYKNSAIACALLVNPPSGLPNCTDNMANLNYRSGSGYCMKSKVCGASVPIDFYKSADNTALLYSWTNTVASALVTNGYKKVGTCYGYKTLDNPGKTSANMETADANSVF